MMKKILMTMLLFVFITAACGNINADETNEAENNVNNDQTVTDEEDSNNDQVKDDGNNESEQNDAEDANEDSNNNSDKKAENQQTEDNDGEVKDKQSEEDQLKDLSFKIFQAQKDEDYDFLKSILAEGASMDTEDNSFYFDNIAYPHELDFVQEDPDNLEYRYIHEDDDGVIIIGYGIVDQETESSYTIDFQFVEEDGKWKMQDMDKNA